MEKIRKLGNNLVVTIPAEIIEWLNLEEGSEVEIEPFVCSGENGARMRKKR
jgi:antitoxin component of MazEF toxin-antitoxin module